MGSSARSFGLIYALTTDCDRSRGNCCGHRLLRVDPAAIAVGDTQFLRSMIPHHASAILMCEKVPIIDAEIKKLCVGIIESQQSEINQMKSKLSQLAN